MNATEFFFGNHAAESAELFEQEFRRSRQAASRLPRSMQATRTQRTRPRGLRRDGHRGHGGAFYDTTTSPEPTRSIEFGSESVRWAQDCLNRIYRTDIPLDGVLDVRGRSLLRRLQRRHNLRPTGLLGPDTRRALERACRNESSESEMELAGDACREDLRISMHTLTNPSKTPVDHVPGNYLLYRRSAKNPFYAGETLRLRSRLLDHRRNLRLAKKDTRNYFACITPLRVKKGMNIKAALKQIQAQDIARYGLISEGGYLVQTHHRELELEWEQNFGELTEIASATTHPPACRCPACTAGCAVPRNIGRWRRRRQHIVVDL